MANILQKKKDFSIGHFMLTLLPLLSFDLGSSKSRHTLFDRYLDYIMVKVEQKRMVLIKETFELFDKKWLPNLAKVLTPFWKT